MKNINPPANSVIARTKNFKFLYLSVNIKTEIDTSIVEIISLFSIY